MIFMVCPNSKILLNLFDSKVLEGNLEEKKFAALEMFSSALWRQSRVLRSTGSTSQQDSYGKYIE